MNWNTFTKFFTIFSFAMLGFGGVLLINGDNFGYEAIAMGIMGIAVRLWGLWALLGINVMAAIYIIIVAAYLIARL